LRLPVYLVVGNHDDRQGLRDAFPAHAYLRMGVATTLAVTRVASLRSNMPDDTASARDSAKTPALRWGQMKAIPVWGKIMEFSRPKPKVRPSGVPRARASGPSRTARVHACQANRASAPPMCCAAARRHTSSQYEYSESTDRAGSPSLD
jgi:hypothetical protein